MAKTGAQPKPQGVGLVADFLHGVIAVTAVERFITSTPAFNRLHDVKQNSTAFLTYPSMVHSRFAHSLGAMHLASRMLVSAISNAQDADRTTFLRSISQILKRLCEFGAVVQATETAYTTWNSKKIEEALRNGTFRATLVYKTAPPGLSEEQTIAYCVALQGLRIAALVHDLGHPPFSHVTEFAIEDLARSVGGTQSQKGRRKALADVFTRTKNESKKLHELLTLDVFKDLKALTVQADVGRNFPTSDDLIFARVSLALALAILQNGRFEANDEKFSDEERLAIRCLRTLEDGELDADRMDYVQRDVLMAGIRDRGFRDDRLLALLRLVYDQPKGEDAKSGQTALATPMIVASIRSLRSLEEFFEWRSELYRTVIYHHHVVRTDSLFQALIRQQCEKILDDSDVDDTPVVHLSTDTSSLHWLWSIYGMQSGSQVKMDIYLQWDDHWLMSVLRKRYLTLKLAVQRREDQGEPEADEEIIELKRLEEIVASKKHYVSLVKRYEHYAPIDEGFLEEWTRLVATWQKDPETMNRNGAAAALTEANDAITSTRPFGFGAGDLQLIWDEPGSETVFQRVSSYVFQQIRSGATKAATRKPTVLVQELIDKALADFKDRENCLDVFLKNKPYKGAMGEKFKLWTDKGVDLLSRQSNLVNELNMRARRSPQFFFYALPRASARLDVEKARRQLGTCLAAAIFADVTEEKKQ